MHIRTINIIAILTILFFNPIYSQQQAPRYKEGELLVKFERNINVRNVLSETEFRDTNVDIIRYFPHLGIWYLKFDESKRNDAEVLSQLRSDNRVVNAQFNHFVTLRSKSSNEPNDEFFEEQWSLNNTGQTGGTLGVDISALDAWNITTGNNGLTALGDEIVIAVIDDGFDLDHEDLNFTSKTYNAYIDSEDPEDIPLANHGTHVSGIIGAIGNNEEGIAGVMWDTKILPVVVDANGGLQEVTVVAAYDYVLGLRKEYNNTSGQAGKYIVATNSSFGVDYGEPEDFPLWCAAYDSLGVHGILNVVATMNQNENVDEVGDVPSACSGPYLISVTNTDHNDNLNAAYGLTTVDLGAPGTNIFSTFIGDNYGAWSGTSFAAPHVAGTVGLIYSILPSEILTHYKDNPTLASLDIKAWILNSVDLIGSLENKTVTGGRLNGHKAIVEMLGFDPQSVSLTGPNLVCSSGFFVYSLNDLPPDVNILWSHSNNLEAVWDSNTGPAYRVVSKTGSVSGSGWVRANVNGIYFTKNMWVGKPAQPTTNPSGYPTVEMQIGSMLSISVVSSPGASGGDFIWEIDGSIEEMSNNGLTCTVEATDYGWGNFWVQSTNQCGISPKGGGSVNVTSDGGGGLPVPKSVSVFPNPTSNMITLEIENNPETAQFIAAEKELFIYDKNEKLLKYAKFRGARHNMSLQSLRPDVYLLKLTGDGEQYSQKIVKEN